MVALLLTLDLILGILTWLIIASAVMSWLFAFNVVNPSNQFVSTVGRALYQVTEPLMRPVRRVLPSVGGLDLSPIVVLVVIFFLRNLIRTSLIPAVV